MKLLILSYYYKPDLSAGSFRVSAIIDELKKKQNQDIEVDLITTMPNRYNQYNIEAKSTEKVRNISIRRINVPASDLSRFLGPIIFLFYAMKVMIFVRNKEYDLIFATSSRLATIALGTMISKMKKVPIFIDIRDIFYETLEQLKKGKLLKIFLPLVSTIESFTITNSTKINLVSEGFFDYFKKKYPSKSYSYLPNGIDSIFMENEFKTTETKKYLEVLYAGNIGDGQGLEHIIPQLAKHFEYKINFKIIGSGSKLNKLKKIIKDQNCKNIKILKPLSRIKLITHYKNADILFMHLNNFLAFDRVLPSKIFEYAATGKPIWAGVSGNTKLFIKKNVENVAVFDPCDIKTGINSFKNLQIKNTDRSNFCKKFSRVQISKNIINELREMHIY